ncbi:hypothetical protein ADUPG1_007942 [Aduncisulcus paluster]|uniref:Uncharacterized protein n=1 Tax=Aduncisulcus paluster TaxID=2918883 RepID=A0ABQ5KSN9_9EUKA|nr:hypothetical protein ADUPG1_007942 [Aduncisulcus paluster]
MGQEMSSTLQIVKPVFIHKGGLSCLPISLYSPNVRTPDFSRVKARDETLEEDNDLRDQTLNVQKMMKVLFPFGFYTFTHISIPFTLSSPMKGAYVCIDCDFVSFPISHLILTLTSSKGVKTSKKYEFPESTGSHWYFLPVDLPDVDLCEITGKGREIDKFNIQNLVFIREETPEEILARKVREKLWSEAPVVKPEYIKEEDEESKDKYSIPNSHSSASRVIKPSLSMIKGIDDSFSKESEFYDQRSQAQKMLKGEDSVYLSHLSIPFPSPSPMKGAYICVDRNASSPSLLFTFTDCDGKKTFKKYEFTRPKHDFEWHFLPIDLNNVVLCDIEGKGMWTKKNCRCFNINSLVFTMLEEEIIDQIAADRLCLLPWK